MITSCSNAPERCAPARARVRRATRRRVAPALALVAALTMPTPAIAQEAGGPPRPAIAVSPARLELEIGDRPVTESIRVMNMTERTVEARVTLATWDLDEHNQLREVEPTPQSLDQWIVVNPVHFTIEAGASQVVRFAIRPRVRPEPGEHRAMIYVQEVEPERSESETSLVRFLFRLGVAVYGHVGPIQRSAVLHGVRLDPEEAPTRLLLDIEATGSAHVRLAGEVAVEPVAGADQEVPEALRAPLPTTPVLPGFRRTVPVPLPRPAAAGRHVARISGMLGDSVPVDWSAPFEAPAPPEPEAPTTPAPTPPPTDPDEDGEPTDEAPGGEENGG